MSGWGSTIGTRPDEPDFYKVTKYTRAALKNFRLKSRGSLKIFEQGEK